MNKRTRRLWQNLFWTVCLTAAAFYLLWRGAIKEDRTFFVILVCATVLLFWMHTWIQRRVAAIMVRSDGLPDQLADAETPPPTFAKAFADGVRLTFVLSLAAFVILRSAILHGSPIGEHLQQAGYAALRLMLSSQGKENPAAVVIDTSDVPLVDAVDPSGAHVRVTDRTPLRKFLELATSNDNIKKKTLPQAIGIDVNFHDDDHFIAAGDDRFLDLCLSREQACRNRLRDSKATDKSAGRDFHIYVGVRSAGDAAKYWLVQPAYDPLAAEMAVPRHDTGRLFASMTVPEHRSAVPMGAALADVEQHPPRPGWLWTVFTEKEFDAGERPLSAETFLVDYSWLAALRAQTRPLADYLRSPDLMKALTGKIVLLGDVKSAPISDAFVVPGDEDPVPGVYLHACAAATLIDQPLYEPRAAVNNMADLLLVVLLLVWLTHVRAKSIQQADHGAALPPAFGLAAIAAVCTSVLLVSFHVVWADFLVVALLVACHPIIEWMTHAVSHWFKRVRLPAMPTKKAVETHAKVVD